MLNNTIDDDKESLYDGFEPEEPKEPAPPRYSRDDPRYWDSEPSPFEHLRPHASRRTYLIWGGVGVLIVLVLILIGSWVTGPYVKDAVQYGYIDHIEERGNLFKTYEGNLIPYKTLHDTTRAYTGDFVFSTDGKIGKTLRKLQNRGTPLRVEYRTYRFAMPWRGDSRTVVIRVDIVSPDSIMPMPRR